MSVSMSMSCSCRHVSVRSCMNSSEILSCHLSGGSLVAMNDRLFSLLMDNCSIFLFMDKASG